MAKRQGSGKFVPNGSTTDVAPVASPPKQPVNISVIIDKLNEQQQKIDAILAAVISLQENQAAASAPPIKNKPLTKEEFAEYLAEKRAIGADYESYKDQEGKIPLEQWQERTERYKALDAKYGRAPYDPSKKRK